MNRTVFKLGGSVLRTPADIISLANLIDNDTPPPIVVVSAFEGVTNRLEKLLAQAQASSSGPGPDVTGLCEHVASFLPDPAGQSSEQHRLATLLQARFDTLTALIAYIHVGGINGTNGTNETLEQLALSYGERFASLIVTGVLNSRGIATDESLPEEIGIMIDETRSSTCIDIEASRPGLLRLNSARVQVIPGYYGVSWSGRVQLLGRNSSDHSAAAIAAAIDAEALVLFKDTEGILSADPALVPHAHTVRHLSYAEAELLARAGGMVLHPETVGPVAKHNIPIRISSFGTELIDSPVTPVTIVTRHPESAPGFKTIAWTPDQAVLEIDFSATCDPTTAAHLLLTACQALPYDHAVLEISDAKLSVSCHDCDFERVLADLQEHITDTYRWRQFRQVSLVRLIGHRPVQDRRLRRKLHDFFRRSSDNRPVRYYCQPCVTTLVIGGDRTSELLPTLHRQFIENAKPQPSYPNRLRPRSLQPAAPNGKIVESVTRL
jgi:aspartate kinase